MDLNKEDKGNRVFILINNNENNICREINYERLKWVIEKEKYSENLKYLTITYGN
jgi:adenine-specific DNA-methyltransferase